MADRLVVQQNACAKYHSAIEASRVDIDIKTMQKENERPLGTI